MLDQGVSPTSWTGRASLGTDEKYITCSPGYNHHNAITGRLDTIPPELSSYENNVMTCAPNVGEYLGVMGCYPICDNRPNGDDNVLMV